MRASAKYIWLFIVAAFVGGFLIYDSAGLFETAPVTPSTAVATVNGEDILYTTWQQLRQQLEQQEGDRLGRTLTLDEQEQLASRAFDQLVEETLVRQEIERRGIEITEKDLIDAARYSPPPELMQSPELQTDGQFDYQKYLRFITGPSAKQSGLLYQLEAYYRNELPKSMFYEQLVSGVYPSDGQLWNEYKDAHDSAQVTWVAFRPGQTPDPDVQVSTKEIQDYYNEHREQFERAGTAVVSFIHLPRTITAADTAATLARITDIRNRILAGTETFADAAHVESADPGSAQNGGSLGIGPASRFVAPFAEAASALKPGEISQPVLTQFGYHIIKLDSGAFDSLALRHILLPITQTDSAASVVDRKADQLVKIANSSDKGGQLEAIAKELGVPVQKANPVEHEPLYVDGEMVPSVGTWAFTGVQPGETSDLFSVETGYYLARLESVTQGGIPPIEEVRSDIRLQIAFEKTLDKLMDPAQKFATAAAASSMEQAGSTLNTPTQQTPMFTRVMPVPGLGHTTAPVGAAFSLPIGAVSQPIRSVDGVYVLRVDRRVDAKREDFEAEKQAMRGQQAQAIQQARIREYIIGLRQTAKIKDRREEIKAKERRFAAS